jgi:hypothetical protein
LVVAGFLVVVLSEFLPVLWGEGIVFRRNENLLVFHREGLWLLVLASASVTVLAFLGESLGKRMAWSLAVIALGVGTSVYASSRVAEEVADACKLGWHCASSPQRPEPTWGPGIALEAGATGGQLIALGGLVLLVGGVRRAPLVGQRPERTHPIWM